ncbi:hypothetical protein [Methylovulum miyakonense]|uniref:hypothetical protein n=1 Tax=Methylovulum miyakonense TaxID=645578 RepID=UPI000377696A|nr:hypothetical protein [Methylovulum miyakonense]
MDRFNDTAQGWRVAYNGLTDCQHGVIRLPPLGIVGTINNLGFPAKIKAYKVCKRDSYSVMELLRNLVQVVSEIDRGLTDRYRGAILSALSPHVTVGPSTPFRYGENRRYPLRYFFARHFYAASCRLFIMVARRGPQKCGPVPYPGVENPLRAASRLFSTIGGGSFLLDMESPL